MQELVKIMICTVVIQAHNIPWRRRQAVQLVLEVVEWGVDRDGAGAEPQIYESLWHPPHQTAGHQVGEAAKQVGIIFHLFLLNFQRSISSSGDTQATTQT